MSTELDENRPLVPKVFLGCLGILTATGCGILALFSPLIITLLEISIFGSYHFFTALDRLGLARPLEVIYGPIVEFLLTIF